MLKACSLCGKRKKETEFYIRSSGKPRADCKACFNARVKANKAKNPEKERAYYRAWCKKQYDADPEKFREKARRIRTAYPDRMRDIWRRNNAKRYAALTPEQRAAERARLNKWAANHREVLRVKDEKWRKENPHKRAATQRARSARKLNATPEWLTPAHKAEIEAVYLEAAILTKTLGIKHHVDHIIPLKGKNCSGLHVPWNLQVLTASANISKGNKLLGDVEMYGEAR